MVSVCVLVCLREVGDDIILQSKCQGIHFQTAMHLLFLPHMAVHLCRPVQGFMCGPSEQGVVHG